MIKSNSRRVFGFFLCLLFAATLISCDSNKDSQPEIKLINTVLNTLCSPEMRGRLAGSNENTAAVNYLTAAFENIGLQPFIKDSFEWIYEQTVYDPDKGETSVRFICSDGEEVIPVFGKDYNFNTAYGDLDVKLDATRNPEDINNETSSRMFLITEKTNAEIQTGFVPVTYYLSLADELTKIVPNAEYWSSLFQIRITGEFSGKIGEKDIVSVEIKNKDTSSTDSLSNVVGYLKGEDSTKAVIVSSHLDAAGYLGEVYVSGAIDNASGTAALAAIAEMLSLRKDELAIDVIFCAFNSEETALKGSETFVKEIMGYYDELYNINIDCIGVIDGGAYMLGIKDNGYEKELNEAMRKTLNSYNLPYNDSSLFGGDHMSFEKYGIPNVIIGQFGNQRVSGIIHTKDDVVSQLDINEIYIVSRAIAAFIIDSGDKTYQSEISEDENSELYQKRTALLKAKEFIKKEAEKMKQSVTLEQDEAYTFTVGIDGKTYYVTIIGSVPYETPEQVRVYYPDFYINKTIGEYKLDSIDIVLKGLPLFSSDKPKGVTLNEIYKMNMNDILSVNVSYFNELRGVSIEIAADDDPAALDSLTKLEGYESYYYQKINFQQNDGSDDSQDNKAKDDIYSVYYYEPGLIVNFSSLVKTKSNDTEPAMHSVIKIMSMKEAAEMVDKLKIHDNSDYYKAVVNSIASSRSNTVKSDNENP